MNNEVLFLAGKYDQIADYPNLVSEAHKSGTVFTPVDLHWQDEPNMYGWTDHILEQVDSRRIRPKTIVGHSIGAVETLLLATVLGRRGLSPNRLVLASLSPIFADDLEDPYTQKIWEERYNGRIPQDIGNIEVGGLISSIRDRGIEVTIFAGGSEMPKLKRRAHTAAQRFGVPARIIDSAGHNVEASSKYRRAIVSAISR